jgi:transmembrane protein EpsG
MFVNLIVIVLILFIGHTFSRGNEAFVNSDKNRKKYIKIIAVILILQSGLRNVAVGTDTYQYYLYFEDIKKTSWNAIFQNFIDVYQLGEGKDAGYLLFQKIVQLFTIENQVFLLVIATLFFTALANFIYKNTNRLSDAIMAFTIYSVLFYSFFSITGHRQTIATAATLFAFELIKKRKLIYFLIVILIAATIHKTCLIFIPLYFLTILKRERIILRITMLCFPVLLFLSSSITGYIIILTESYEEYEHMAELKPITFTVLMLLVTLMSLIKYDRIIKEKSEASYYYSALTLAILFLSLVFEIHGYMRIVQYFSIFILVMIPLIINSFLSYGVKIQRLVYSLAIILLLFFFIKSNIDSEYKFFWQEMQLNKVYL